MYDPTVARLTYRGLLGRRRALVLGALPVLLIVISAVVRALTGADDQVATTSSAVSPWPRWCRSSVSSPAPAPSGRRS